MGIQAHVKAEDFVNHGGVIEYVPDPHYYFDHDLGEEMVENYVKPIFFLPSGLVATSYHPDDLVFDCKNTNKQFVDELEAMGCTATFS